MAGFEPTTSCSQIAEKPITAPRRGSQPVGIIHDRKATAVHPSQPLAGFSRKFTSPVLPLSPNGSEAGGGGFKVTDSDDDLLTVKDLADLLKVCTATVYKMVDRLHIPHLRVLNSIRFRRGDVRRFVEGMRR